MIRTFHYFNVVQRHLKPHFVFHILHKVLPGRGFSETRWSTSSECTLFCLLGTHLTGTQHLLWGRSDFIQISWVFFYLEVGERSWLRSGESLCYIQHTANAVLYHLSNLFFVLQDSAVQTAFKQAGLLRDGSGRIIHVGEANIGNLLTRLVLFPFPFLPFPSRSDTFHLTTLLPLSWSGNVAAVAGKNHPDWPSLCLTHS